MLQWHADLDAALKAVEIKREEKGARILVRHPPYLITALLIASIPGESPLLSLLLLSHTCSGAYTY